MIPNPKHLDHNRRLSRTLSGRMSTLECYTYQVTDDSIIAFINEGYANTYGFTPITLGEFQKVKEDEGFDTKNFILAFLNNELAGLCLTLTSKGFGKANLKWLCVHPKHRGIGLGKALIVQCFEHLKNMGAKDLQAGPFDVRDSKTHGFMLRMGFTAVSHELLMRINLKRALEIQGLPEGYSLRSLRPGDEEGWLKVRNRAFRDEAISNHPWSIDQFRREFVESAYSEEGRIFIAEHYGEVVGTASAWFMKLGEARKPVVHWLAVLPEHRRIGLGKALTLQVLYHFKELGFAEVWLITYAELGVAVRLYRRFGFNVERERITYSRQLSGRTSST